jgi:xylulokinase
MNLVAGIDSSTQSCKVVIRDADTGALVRTGRATHPDGTECDPQFWWQALKIAIDDAGGFDDVSAISVAAQQHGMVTLDGAGEVVRPALLWNDTRSAQSASDLVHELGGGQAWADAVGSVPVAAFTITKLRWLAEHEKENAARVAAVALPHDWLTWKLSESTDISTLTTDRSDASGTGYWSSRENVYRMDLLKMAFGREVLVPRVLAPTEIGARTSRNQPLGPGAGDNAGAALGVGARAGDVIVSIGTSGTVFAVAEVPAADPTGNVAGFADCTGRFLPLVCTLNAARILDAMGRILGVDHAHLAELALNAPAGCDGLVLIPYFEGERTPNKPDATGAMHGMNLKNSTPAHMARAAFEGVLSGLGAGIDALLAQGANACRILLVGGGAQSEAIKRIAPSVFGLPVIVPPAGEYVADGASRQAAWILNPGDQPPDWEIEGEESFTATSAPFVRERYEEVSGMVANRL